jgi:YHS domain-containing protein
MKRTILLVAALMIAIAGYTQTTEVFTTAKGAINGYDPVAYFKQSKPVKGDHKFAYDWHGATWYFSSKENMEAFKSAPEQYAPQCGGFCDYGMSQGHKSPTSPDAWTIVDGKLYLNYNNDVKAMWSKDRANLIKKADENWVKLKNVKQ